MKDEKGNEMTYWGGNKPKEEISPEEFYEQCGKDKQGGWKSCPEMMEEYKNEVLLDGIEQIENLPSVCGKINMSEAIEILKSKLSN